MNSYQLSTEKLGESARYLAGGVASSLRAAMKPTPLFAESGKGARIKDVDGNEYIDYLLAYGPLILGHAHPVLTKKVHQAMQRGYTFGLQHEGEIQLAKRLTEILPCADRVALSGSGTEAVMLALRLARAYTGKTKIVRFHGHYHGWSDSIFTSFPSADMKGEENGEIASNTQVHAGTAGQSEASLSDVILLPWNDEQVIEQALKEQGDEIAAVITEPVMCNSGCLAPKPGYLEKLRKLTEEHQVVLIFDEVITGFRLALGGAQEVFKVVPDLMTMGKAMAGGIALSAVGGKEEIMELIATGKVNHLGTMNGNAVSTAAALATIEELAKDDGAAFVRMSSLAAQLAQGIRESLEQHGVPGVVNQVGPVFHLMFVDRKHVDTFDAYSERDAAKYTLFAEKLLDEGVLVRTSGLWYVSAVHGDIEVEQTLSAIDRVLASMVKEVTG